MLTLFLSDYRDAGITPAVTTITVSGMTLLSTFSSLLPPLSSVSMPPGAVRLMHMLLYKYIHIDPCRHIYLAVFPFQISWLSLTFNAQWNTHSHTAIFTQFAHHKYFFPSLRSKGISCTPLACHCVMWSADQHWGGACLFDCCWISASQQQVGGVPLLLTWLGCRGQRNSTSVRKR